MPDSSGVETPARIAVVHSFYSSSQPSGENNVVEQQVRTLRRAGHEVRLVAQRTDLRSRRATYPFEAALTAATGMGPDPLKELRSFAPDVVHVHNLFPNFGRNWVRRWTGPVVGIMHNYRPLCAAATFYRQGSVCTDCLDRHSVRPALAHGCYRGSRWATAPVAAGIRYGSDPLLQRADMIVTLNPTMRDLYRISGVPESRLALVPNFLSDPQPPGPGGTHWIYVGRLSPEKGALQLARDWPAGPQLLIAGSGPDAASIAAAAPRNVTLLGEQSPRRVAELLRSAIGLVLPSRWFEGSPMVYLEALAAGTPVLAWEPSSVAHNVESEGTGLVVRDLGRALTEAEGLFPTLRDHCRSVFQAKYAEDAWLRAITDVNQEAAREGERRAGPRVSGRHYS